MGVAASIVVVLNLIDFAQSLSDLLHPASVVLFALVVVSEQTGLAGLAEKKPAESSGLIGQEE